MPFALMTASHSLGMIRFQLTGVPCRVISCLLKVFEQTSRLLFLHLLPPARSVGNNLSHYTASRSSKSCPTSCYRNTAWRYREFTHEFTPRVSIIQHNMFNISLGVFMLCLYGLLWDQIKDIRADCTAPTYTHIITASKQTRTRSRERWKCYMSFPEFLLR